MNYTWTNLWHNPKCIIIVVYLTSHHRLAIQIDRWSTIPILGIKDYAIGMIHNLCWVSHYNFIIGRFPSMFQVVWKYFFQLDHWVDCSPHLTEACAIHCSTRLAFLPPSWCTSSIISLLVSWTLKSNPFRLMERGSRTISREMTCLHLHLLYHLVREGLTMRVEH